MPENLVERRRWRRRVVPVGRNEELEVAVTHTVQILDISSNGALLVWTGEAPTLRRVVLCTVLGGEPFEAEAEVRHEQYQDARQQRLTSRRIGVAFTLLDERNRMVIERFLAMRGRRFESEEEQF